MNEAPKHTEGEWSFHPVHPHEMEKGVVVTHWHEPPQLFAVKATFLADYPQGKGLRTTVYIADVHITKGREAEAEANAKIYSAAPEMLAALKAAIKISDERLDPWLGRTPECQAVYDQCAAAVAKAEGPRS